MLTHTGVRWPGCIEHAGHTFPLNQPITQARAMKIRPPRRKKCSPSPETSDLPVAMADGPQLHRRAGRHAIQPSLELLYCTQCTQTKPQRTTLLAAGYQGHFVRVFVRYNFVMSQLRCLYASRLTAGLRTRVSGLFHSPFWRFSSDFFSSAFAPPERIWCAR